MEAVIKFNNQSTGRDRLFRLLQYGSRTLWYLIETKQLSSDVVDTLKNLESTMSTFRRLLRLGRCFDTLYGALNSMTIPDKTVRITCTLSRIAQALFLLADHLIWVGRMGISKVDDEKWSRTSNKYWLLSIVMNLVRDFYEIWNILKSRKHSKQNGYRSTYPLRSALKQCIVFHKDVTLDVVKNGCDFFLPMSSLGYIKLNSGMIGLLGVISSIAGIYTMIDPDSKLIPS